MSQVVFITFCFTSHQLNSLRSNMHLPSRGSFKRSGCFAGFAKSSGRLTCAVRETMRQVLQNQLVCCTSYHKHSGQCCLFAVRFQVWNPHKSVKAVQQARIKPCRSLLGLFASPWTAWERHKAKWLFQLVPFPGENFFNCMSLESASKSGAVWCALRSVDIWLCGHNSSVASHALAQGCAMDR